MRTGDGIDGLHLMANLHCCETPPGLLGDAEALRASCLELVAQAALTPVGECFHQFGEGGGVTGVVMLAESHLSLHTWPEKRFVTLDVFVCNMHCDNRTKARQLFAALLALFGAATERIYEMQRA